MISYRPLEPADKRDATSEPKKQRGIGKTALPRLTSLIGHGTLAERRSAAKAQLGKENKCGSNQEQTEPCLVLVRPGGLRCSAACASCFSSCSSSPPPPHLHTRPGFTRVPRQTGPRNDSIPAHDDAVTDLLSSSSCSARPTLFDSAVATLNHARLSSTTHAHTHTHTRTRTIPISKNNRSLALDSPPTRSAGRGICPTWRRSRSSSPRPLPA